MSFQKIVVLCLLSVGIGAAVGMLDATLVDPDGGVVTSALSTAEIRVNSTASTLLGTEGDDDLTREKADALRALLTEHDTESE